jgi:hypothetical protein
MMRAVRWIARHPVLVLAIIVVLVPLGLGLEWWYLPSVPTTTASSVEAIDVRLHKWESSGMPPECHQDAAEITITDPALIEQFLNVFRFAKRAEEHKCPSSGTIVIRRTDGTLEELFILAGHNEEYYEYRMGSRINKVPRSSFLEAIKALGLKQIKTMPP